MHGGLLRLCCRGSRDLCRNNVKCRDRIPPMHGLEHHHLLTHSLEEHADLTYKASHQIHTHESQFCETSQLTCHLQGIISHLLHFMASHATVHSVQLPCLPALPLWKSLHSVHRQSQHAAAPAYTTAALEALQELVPARRHPGKPAFRLSLPLPSWEELRSFWHQCQKRMGSLRSVSEGMDDELIRCQVIICKGSLLLWHAQAQVAPRDAPLR